MDTDEEGTGAPVNLSDAYADVILPKFIKWKSRQVYSIEDEFFDYETLEDLGRAITKARKAAFLLTEKINEYERLEREAKLNYDRTLRREYLSSTAKTEASKKAYAELKCEELENEWIKNNQMKEELMRMSFSMKTELQILQTIANNLRQQLKII